MQIKVNMKIQMIKQAKKKKKKGAVLINEMKY
jgi:hypothetical protein